MNELALNKNTISSVISEVAEKIPKLMSSNLVEIKLYGSCARGDFTGDSDIDIALLTKMDRENVNQYSQKLSEIAADLAIKYFAIVNFVCLPYDEYVEKKSWYPYYKNIDQEGRLLYG